METLLDIIVTFAIVVGLILIVLNLQSMLRALFLLLLGCFGGGSASADDMDEGDVNESLELTHSTLGPADSPEDSGDLFTDLLVGLLLGD